MTVAVFGLGFVGLTTALGLAHIGHRVYGVEVDPDRRRLLQEGKIPFHEPYLREQLEASRSAGKFMAAESVDEAVAESEIIFYCVGTPYGPGGEADLTYLFRAIDQTLAAIHDTRNRVLVTKSTIPPSTTKERIIPYVESNAPEDAQLCVANNPEFLREGFCWEDFIGADRIVIGCDSEWGRERLYALYEPLNVPICLVSPSTGEFIKYLSNSLLATLISFSNEMAQIGETVGNIQIAEAFRVLHMDKRWKQGSMASYAYPGCGYGGYCLPKDTSALRALSRRYGVEPAILDAVIKTNEARLGKIAVKIASNLRTEQVIGIAGLAFKPGSDDVRESSAKYIVEGLIAMGYHRLLAYDPLAANSFQKAYPELELRYCKDLDELCAEADCIAIMTAWPEFKRLAQWNGGRVIDCRYML